ncbi:MAG TPA: hypothetical protein VI363_02200, partial [Burkholderiales bacterium]
ALESSLPVPVGDAVTHANKGTRRRSERSHAGFDLLVNFFTATRKFAERLAQNPPAAIAGTKSLIYQAAVTPTRQQLDAEAENIIGAMLTEEFRVAVKKFTSKGK